MAANIALIPVQSKGLSAGFSNLMKYGLASWWLRPKWMIQTAIWLFLINGMLALVLNVPTPGEVGAEALIPQGLAIFCVFSGMMVPIGAMIASMSALIGEKTSGTAAWVLSKPVSRTAFVLSKLLPDLLGFFVTAVVIQAVVAYILLTTKGEQISVIPYLLGLGVLELNLIFYQTFSLMLGAFLNSRGAVIGIGLILIFVFNQINTVPWLPGYNPNNAVAVMVGAESFSWAALIVTVVAIIFFMALALWRFEREEF